MNSRTSKIIRRYSQATGAPEKLIKRVYLQTPAHNREKALVGMMKVTVQKLTDSQP